MMKAGAKMFEAIDFSAWKVYDGASEGSGRSEKVWLISDDGRIGLFKYPKIDPADQKETTEHISEHLAHQLGNILGIPTAKVDIGIRDGRIGSMSYLVRKNDEMLIEGINFIAGKYPMYNAETMQDEDSGIYYCFNQILNSLDIIRSEKMIPFWIDIMLFDYLIGNADRHQSNWALLFKVTKELTLPVRTRFCPLYDNGSSLCCYVNEKQTDSYLGNDTRRFESLVDSKSTSMIRIDGTQKARPRHREVVEYLLHKYPAAPKTAKHFIECLSEDVVNDLMSQYSEQILAPKKNELICRYLLKKIDLLNHLLTKEDRNHVMQ